MSLNIEDLKKLWKQEKEEYITQEIGSGVQKFVKKIFNCTQLFNLSEGKLSTPDQYRKEEFLEEKTKKSKRADIIIFIDPDRIIPVEVEKFGNIKAGKEQIFNYQRVWEKKYGLLTDGNEWIFFNNNIPIKLYKINDIFKNPSEFLEFWNEYIQPKNYYLQFFEIAGQLEVFEEDLSTEKHRQKFFEEITTLIKSFKNKLNIKGYFNNIGEKESEKRAVEITYAYLIQFILYKTLVDNEFQEFHYDFTSRLKRIHKNLISENFSDILTAIKAISTLISKNIYRPFSQEQESINNKLEYILSKPQNEISDVTPWLDIFIFIKRYNFANVRNEIFGYIYENYLKDLYLDEKKGQYFTDPAVVDFMLEQIVYNSENIKSRLKEDIDSISLIDPSCGSGTFLYSAIRNIIDSIPNNTLESSKKIEELVNNNIFGLDIEEFPLYLAEMSIIMRMLPLIISEKYNNPIDKKIKIFKTRDSISEFLDTAVRNTLNDIRVEYEKNKGQLSILTKELNLGYSSYVRDEDDLNEMKKSIENLPRIPRYRFDYVIGNPPYIGYNECSKQGLLFFNKLKKSEVKLNNVYGVNLHSIPDKPKRYRPNPNLYAFFIALGIALLKYRGKLCYIIPQTILTAGDLDVLRYHLAKFTTIEKIIVFSGKMFIGRGIKQNIPVQTSSLIFVLKKIKPSKLSKVEIIYYKNPNDDVEKCLDNISKGIKIDKKKILQNQLISNYSNWNFIIKDKNFIEFLNKYKINSENISIYYTHSQAEILFKSKFYFDSGYNIDDNKILENPPNEEYYYYPKLNNNYLTIKEFRGYWPNQRNKNNPYFIGLRQANQGYLLLNSKYKIVWSYSNPEKFFYTELPLIWPRNQICAIGSENKPELLYLFSILNSSLNNTILINLLKSQNEKNLQISTSSIKEFVRIPIIKDYNKELKDEVIKLTKKLIILDMCTIGEIIDFENVIMQKFNSYVIDGENLILKRYDKKVSCKIKGNFNLVDRTLSNIFNKDLFSNDIEISLSNIKSLPVIDINKQRSIKNYIDDLIFALYFNIQLPVLGLENAKKIKQTCQKNKFYYVLKN